MENTLFAILPAVGLLLLAQGNLQASDPVLVGQWPGYTRGGAYSVAVVGNTAYIAGGAFHAIDIANPASPRRVGGCELPGQGQLAVSGAYAYAATGDALHVVDISDPSNPRQVAQYAPAGNGVAISGTFAYVSTWESNTLGLAALDISNPLNPHQVGAYSSGGSGGGGGGELAASGQYVYLAAGNRGLEIIDVSDPTSPHQVGAYTNGLAYASAVDVSGSYAYVSDALSGLHVIDVSNPAHPVRLGGFTLSGWRIKVVGTQAYVANGYGGLQILDVSNPAQPTALGNYSITPSGPAVSVAVSGQYAFVAAGDSGLQIVDVADPSSPQGVGTERSFAGETVRLAKRGNLVFLAEVNGLRVIDTADPAHPTQLGFCPTKGEALGVAVSGNYAFVACYAVLVGPNGPYGGGGLQVIDISDPANPQRVAGFDTAQDFYGVTVSGDHAYEFGAAGLSMFDISSPLNPTEEASRTAWFSQGIAVSGNYAYFAGVGLRVVDVSDPTNPLEVATLSSGGLSYGVAVVGHYALIGNDSGGLQIIDVADPANPQWVGNFVTANEALEIAVSGNLAYVAVGDAGVQVIDLTDPAHPLPYALLNTDGGAVGVAVAGDLIYVADSTKGLKILRRPGPDLAYQRSGNSLALSWPASATGFVLQSATTLANGGDWQDSLLIPILTNGQKLVTVTPAGSRGFFRLRKL